MTSSEAINTIRESLTVKNNNNEIDVKIKESQSTISFYITNKKNRRRVEVRVSNHYPNLEREYKSKIKSFISIIFPENNNICMSNKKSTVKLRQGQKVKNFNVKNYKYNTSSLNRNDLIQIINNIVHTLNVSHEYNDNNLNKSAQATSEVLEPKYRFKRHTITDVISSLQNFSDKERCATNIINSKDGYPKMATFDGADFVSEATISRIVKEVLEECYFRSNINQIVCEELQRIKPQAFKGTNGNKIDTIASFVDDESGAKTHISTDDDCYVIYQQKVDGKYETTDYISPIVFDVLKTIPNPHK